MDTDQLTYQSIGMNKLKNKFKKKGVIVAKDDKNKMAEVAIKGRMDKEKC